MFHQVRILCEVFPTLGAIMSIGHVPFVTPLVAKKTAVLPESFPTFGTQEGHLPRVNPLVGEQVGALSKAFAAFGAQVRPHPFVELPVFKEV